MFSVRDYIMTEASKYKSHIGPYDFVYGAPLPPDYEDAHGIAMSAASMMNEIIFI